MYWFTNTTGKKGAKFQNNLLNEVKSEVSTSGLLLCSRLREARAHTPHGSGCRLEEFSQSDIPSTTP
jgi:hypothetical protein